MKFYAIKCDTDNVIFESWDEAKEFMVGKKNIKQKSFKTYEEAQMFLMDKELEVKHDIPTVYIDGSYDQNTGCYSFGGVLIIDNINYQFNKKFEADEYSSSRNVAGEIKGASYIINHCVKNNIKEINLYYDYAGIEEWYNNSWQAKTPIAMKYVEFVNSVKDKIKVNFIKVKSHSNNKYNDLADSLAKKALGIK